MKHFINFVLLLSIFLIPLSVWGGIIEDDFDDGDFNGWVPYNCTPEVNCGEWTIKSGVLHYKGPNARSVCYLTMGEDSWKDYTISCKARMLEGFWRFSRIMIATRMVPAPGTNHVYYIFGPTPFGDLADVGVFNGDENWKDFEMEMGQWYKLRAEAMGPDHKFYIDDELVVSNHIPGLTAGRLGIGCCGAEIELDDVVITGADIKDKGSKNSAVAPKMKMTILWGKIKLPS